MEKNDILRNVPLKVAQKCLLYLNCDSTLKLRYVSKTWKQITQEYFWKKKCVIDKITDVNYPNETKKSKNFMSSHDISSYCERLWIYRTFLKQNWLNKPILQIKRPGLLKDVHFCDECIIVTYDPTYVGKFQIYNADVKLLDSFTVKQSEHPSFVRKDDIIIVDYLSRFIIARNFKKRILLWKRDFGDILKEQGINRVVYGDLLAIPTHYRRIVSFIEILTGNIKFRVIVGHAIDFLAFYNNNLLTVTLKGCLRIQNIKSGLVEICHKLDKRCYRGTFFTFTMIKDSYLFITNSEVRRKMWIYEINEGRKVLTFPGHFAITAENSKFVYKESSKCIKIKDYTNNVNDTLAINTKTRITSVAVNKDYIIVGTLKDIAVFDFFTGKMKRLISVQELFGVLEDVYMYLHATDTKLLVLGVYGEETIISKSFILDFDFTM